MAGRWNVFLLGTTGMPRRLVLSARIAQAGLWTVAVLAFLASLVSAFRSFLYAYEEHTAPFDDLPWFGSPLLLGGQLDFDIMPVLLTLFGLACIACGPLFLVWQYQAHKYLSALGIDLRWTALKSLVIWFIPIVNLLTPYKAITELWKASVYADQPNWRTVVRPRAIEIWWMGLILGGTLQTIALRLFASAFFSPDMVLPMSIAAASDFCFGVAGVLGARLVAQIHAGQRRLSELADGLLIRTA